MKYKKIQPIKFPAVVKKDLQYFPPFYTLARYWIPNYSHPVGQWFYTQVIKMNELSGCYIEDIGFYSSYLNAYPEAYPDDPSVLGSWSIQPNKHNYLVHLEPEFMLDITYNNLANAFAPFFASNRWEFLPVGKINPGSFVMKITYVKQFYSSPPPYPDIYPISVPPIFIQVRGLKRKHAEEYKDYLA